MPRPRKAPPASRSARAYGHPSADLPLRPEVGMQAQFKKHKPPQTCRYDSSLSPALDRDGQNLARKQETAENCEAVFNVPATYVQATPDLLMGDLLKNMRSSQIFSVCGSPEIRVAKAQSSKRKAPKPSEEQFQVELLGLDVFDPVTMEVTHRAGADVPAWFLDADYNGRVFHVTQAFFPRTGAWESLKKALKGDYDETVWDHLAGTVSAPFAAGEHRQIAVKVIDDRGNDLLMVRKLEEGR